MYFIIKCATVANTVFACSDKTAALAFETGEFNVKLKAILFKIN